MIEIYYKLSYCIPKRRAVESFGQVIEAILNLVQLQIIGLDLWEK